MASAEEQDAQFTAGDVERRVAELERKLSLLDATGLDRLTQSGYLQFDGGIPVRMDKNGIQVEKTSNPSPGSPGLTALYFVPELSVEPGFQPDRAYTDGLPVAGSSTVAALTAVSGSSPTDGTGGTTAGVFVTANNTTGDRYVRIRYALVIEGSTDPPLFEDGMLWYNSTDDKLYARINGVTVELGGGSGMPMPPVVSSLGWHGIGNQLVVAGSSPASATWPTANKAIYVPLLVTEDITVVKLWCMTGATSSGNVNMALYNSSFAQVANSEIGSTGQGTINVIQEFDISDVALSAGLYYIALVMDNTTGTMFRATVTQAAEGAQAYGVFIEASAFNLPNTATPVAAADNFVPWCGIATRTLVT